MRRVAPAFRGPAVGMAAGTALSRATGLARTVALAAALGVGSLSDAYNTANTAPNMLFALAAGGVLGSALVPMLAREEDDERRAELASVVLGTVTVLALVAATAMALGAPLLMRLLAAGAGDREDRGDLLAVGTTWMRIFAPQVALYAVGVTSTGVMAARGRLVLGAAAPVATNVLTVLAAGAAIAASGGRAPSAGDVPASAVTWLGWGTTAAVAAMVAIQLWGARRTEPGLRFAPRVHHRAVTELRRLGGWVLLYVVVNQVALGVVVALASAVDGGVTAYQWAFMLMQLPYAVVAVSVFSGAFPEISRAAARGPDVTAEVTAPARTALALLVPAAAGLALLAPVVAAAAVGPDGGPLVAAGLRGFAVSLIPFSVFQLLTRASYAASDARTPALVNIAVNASMLVVDLAVLGAAGGARARVTGLALGHAVSYVVGCAVLGRLLVRRGALRGRPAATGVAGSVAATALMAAVLLAAPLPSRPATRPAALAAAVAGVALGGTAYAVGLAAARAVARPRVRSPAP